MHIWPQRAAKQAICRRLNDYNLKCLCCKILSALNGISADSSPLSGTDCKWQLQGRTGQISLLTHLDFPFVRATASKLKVQPRTHICRVGLVPRCTFSDFCPLLDYFGHTWRTTNMCAQRSMAQRKDNTLCVKLPLQSVSCIVTKPQAVARSFQRSESVVTSRSITIMILST